MEQSYGWIRAVTRTSQYFRLPRHCMSITIYGQRKTHRVHQARTCVTCRAASKLIEANLTRH